VEPLTPRQWQVVELVVEGYTNRRIATRLGISVRTAETHLDEIRNKLGVGNRAQIAAWAASKRAQADRPGDPAGDHRASGPQPAPGLRGTSRQSVLGQMPADLTSFIGRADDLRRLRDLVPRSRLLTLWGPGGSGKTRLALQMAGEVSDAYEGRVWLVELGRVSQQGLVTLAIAEALDIREDPRATLADSVVRRLAGGRALIILDTCEHLVPEVASTALALAGRCPEATFVATSQEPLRVSGERLYQVRPLSLPDAAAAAGDVAATAASEAVQLFIDRARAFVPEFELSDANVAAVANVCHSLDGLPLAIELAAADLTIVSVQQLAQRLGESLELLSKGARDRPDRQRTLEAMISWSHHRLGDRERALFRRLAVFRSTFDIAAAEEVCAGGELDVGHVGVALAELVSRSLVVADQGSCRQLDTIRDFGLRQLAAAGEHDSVYRRLAEHCLASHHGEARPVRRPAAEHVTDVDADLQTALGWCETGDGDLGLRLAVAAAQRWAWRGYPTEARGWLERLALRVPQPSGLATRAELEIAKIAFVLGDYDGMEKHIEAAIEAMNAVPDPALYAVAQRLQGLRAYVGLDHDRALPTLRDAVETARQAGDRWGEAQAHYHLGCALAGAGYLEEGQAQLRQSLAVREELGQRGAPVMTLTVLALVTLLLDDGASARKILADALDAVRPDADMRVQACLDVAACIAVTSGDRVSALRLSGASGRLLEQSGLHPPADWAAAVSAILEPARQATAPGDLECLLSQGRAMTAEQAAELAAMVIDA
jgi:non-specific serine/threonine protein kinase